MRSDWDMVVVVTLVELFSAVCPILRIFRPILYGSYANHDTRKKTVRLTLPPLAQAAIALASEMTVEASRGHTYSFDHFVPRPPSYVIEFDGSIYGLGGRVFSVDPSGLETLHLELSLPLPTRINEDDSLRTRVQNSCELLAALVTLVAAVTSLPSVGPVLLRGDSKVALSWMETDHFRSPHSLRTALVLASVSHRYGVRVVDMCHLAAVDNSVCLDTGRVSIVR